jgi:hypothetical protein
LVERLLLVRNPWGKHEYTGDLSDFSSLWTTAYKAQVSKKSFSLFDGLFYIPVTNFKSIFSHFTITYYHDDWKKSFYERTNAGTTSQSFFFTVPRT